MLIRHEGVGNAAHAWLLQELLHYLQHENSGCHGFQNMGAAWVPVRRGIDDETLCQGDPRALEVIENWERLVRQVCLRLGGELGQKVLPVQRAKRGADPHVRRVELADQLCAEGRLHAVIRIEGTPGLLAITADLRTGKLRTSIEVPAPESGYPLSKAKRLIHAAGGRPGRSAHRDPRRGRRTGAARHSGTAAARARRHPAQGRCAGHRFPALALQGHGERPGQRGVGLHPERRRGGGPLLQPASSSCWRLSRPAAPGPTRRRTCAEARSGRGTREGPRSEDRGPSLQGE